VSDDRGKHEITGDHSQLLQALGDGELSLGDLSAVMAKPAADVAVELSRLELAGLVYATTLGYRRGR